MGQEIKALLFFDKFRSIATFFVVLILAVVLGVQYFFPRPVKLDQEALASLRDATEQIKQMVKTADNFAQEDQAFKTTLQQRITAQSKLRGDNYATLAAMYGVPDLDDGTIATTGGINYGMQPQPDGLGSKYLPPSTSDPGPVRHLQQPIDPSAKATDPGISGVSGGDSRPTFGASIGAFLISGTEQLPATGSQSSGKGPVLPDH